MFFLSGGGGSGSGAAMSAADLQRLVQRATPRVEDHRSPDRQDFIRREHGHLTLREAVDALDALEFSACAFVEIGRELPTVEEPTAVHGLHRAMAGLRFSCRALSEAAAPDGPAAGEEEAPEGEATEEQAKAAAVAKQRGAEAFKQKDFAVAETAYSEAIRALPRGHSDLHTLYSNRCAVRLQVSGSTAAASEAAALADARRCVELAPQWPKGRFREGTCLRQLGCFQAATAAFRAGRGLEPDNKDWDREVERTEQLRSATLPVLARQVLFSLLPDLLWAWSRGGDRQGVLQVQVNGELAELGKAKWRLVRDGQKPAAASLRYAFLNRKDYLANIAANLQSPPKEGVAVVDAAGEPLRIAELATFLQDSDGHAVLHLDVRGGGADKMVALLCRVPCDVAMGKFLGTKKEPEAPKGSVENVLGLQRNSGFPKALPRLLGFQALPGDLNFPVIDLARDAPNLAS